MTVAATVTEFLSGEPDPLIKRGRYQIIPKPPIGEKAGAAKAHTRITNFAKKLEDEYNLTKWKQRMVLLGAAQRSDITLAALAGSDDKNELDRLADAAMEAARANVKRETGSALHKLCERVDAGEDLALPEPWKSDVAAYRRCLADMGAEVELSEQVVICPKLGLAGRFDRTVIIGAGLPEEQRYIMDIKTGRDLSFSWGSISIQLALYANAETMYDPDRKVHTPMPPCNQEKALVLHLPAEKATCTPYWVDLAAGRRGIALVSELLNYRKGTKSMATLAAIPHFVASEAVREYAVSRIEYVFSRGYGEELARLWPDDVPTLKSYKEHTEAQLDKVIDVCDEIEARHVLEFPDFTDPRGLEKF